MGRDSWTFLTNHGHVLVCLAMEPEVLVRDVAVRVGITERAVQQIVTDLERAGVIERMRVGRRNQYVVRRDKGFRHRMEAGVTIGEFIDVVCNGRDRRTRPRSPDLVDAGGPPHGDHGPTLSSGGGPLRG